MTEIKKILLGIVYSNIYLSLGASLLYFSLGSLLEIETNISMAFFCFGITFIYYNVCQCIGLKGKELNEMTPLQYFVARNMTELVFMMFFIFCICSYFFIKFQSYEQIYFTIILALIGFLYLFFYERIQHNSIVKPIAISMSWALLPFFALNISLLQIDFWYFFPTFLYIFLLSIVYDQKENSDLSFIHIHGVFIARIAIIVFHLLILVILLIRLNNYSLSSLSLFIIISISILLIGIHKKEEWWHLIMTDGLIYVFSAMLLVNSY